MDAAERTQRRAPGPSDGVRAPSAFLLAAEQRASGARRVLGRIAAAADDRPRRPAPGARPAGLHRRRPIDDAVAMVPPQSGVVGARLAPRPELRADASSRHRHAGAARRAARVARAHRLDRRVEPRWHLCPRARAAQPRCRAPGDHAREPVSHGRRRPQLGVGRVRLTRAGTPRRAAANRQKEEERERVPVPTTAIYWASTASCAGTPCIDQVGPEHENVEIRAVSGLSHTRRCSQDRRPAPQLEGRWRPFKPARAAPVIRALRAGARAPPRRAWRGLRP
jgi:hypothetical protein